MRAIRREAALPVLRERVAQLLADGTPCDAGKGALLESAVERAFSLAETAAAVDRAHLARQAASALYHVVTLAGMRWEARHAGLPQRALLADLVLAHRLAPRDPLADDSVETDPRFLVLLGQG
jgi:hypothetical protein